MGQKSNKKPTSIPLQTGQNRIKAYYHPAASLLYTIQLQTGQMQANHRSAARLLTF